MAAPNLQATGSANAVTTGSLTLTLPAHQADDILVATVCIWAPNTTTPDVAAIPTPSGWLAHNSINNPFASPRDGRMQVFFRLATSGAMADPVFTRGTGWDTGTDTAFAGRAYVIRGADVSNFASTFGLDVPGGDGVTNHPGHTVANGAVPALTVRGSERLGIHFLVKTDDFVTAPTVSGWTADFQSEFTTGTGASLGSFRKNNISSSTSADASTVEAPAAGYYGFFGFIFKPAVVDTTVVAVRASATASVRTATLVPQVKPIPPPGGTTASAPTPNRTTTVPVPAAGAFPGGPEPLLLIVVTVPSISAAAALPLPSFSTGTSSTVQAPVASAAASFPSPSSSVVGGTVAIEPPSVSASAGLPAPVGVIEARAPPAATTASALPPLPSLVVDTTAFNAVAGSVGPAFHISTFLTFPPASADAGGLQPLPEVAPLAVVASADASVARPHRGGVTFRSNLPTRLALSPNTTVLVFHEGTTLILDPGSTSLPLADRDLALVLDG